MMVARLVLGLWLAAMLLGVWQLEAAQPATAQPATGPTSAPAMVEFVSEAFAIRLRYPAGWNLAGQLQPGQAFGAAVPSANASDKRSGVLTLRIDRGGTNSTDAAQLADLSDGIAAYVFNNGAKHVTIHPDTMGLLPAWQIRFTSEAPGGPAQAIYIVAVKQHVQYVWNFAAPVELFDSLLPQVREMLKSFETLN